jgi:hypothetical protein
MTRRAPRAVVDQPSEGVAFGTPPPKRQRKYDWAAIAKKCKRRPGQWFLVFEQDKTTYSATIRQGGIAALKPELGFEMRTANNKTNVKPRVQDLWVRYVPENDTTKEK